MDVTAEQLRAFVEMHCALLKGEEPSDASALGDLALVLANASGWRPHAVVESSQLLRELLDVFLAEKLPLRHRPEDVRDALSLLWGLDGAVHSADAASKVIPSAHDGKTVTRWANMAITKSVEWAAANASRFISVGGRPRANPGRMLDWRGDPANWPSDPQRTEWLNVARPLLAPWVRPEEPSDELPAVVLQALRTLIADDFMAEVAGKSLGRPVPTPSRRKEDAWRDQVNQRDLLPLPRTEPLERRRRKQPIESHAIFRAIRPWREMAGIRLDGDDLEWVDGRETPPHRRAAARLLLRTGYRITERPDFGRRLNDRIQEIENRLRLTEIVSTRPTSAKPVRAKEEYQSVLGLLQDRDVPLDADWCLEASEAIYAIQPAESAREFCTMYVEKRAQYDDDHPWRRAGFVISDKDELGQLAIADFNVHLKMVDANMPREAAQLQRRIDMRGERYPLRHLAKRNQALFYSKDRRHGPASDLIQDAYLDVVAMSDRDAVRKVELMHQIALSASAIAAKYLEDRLRVARPGEHLTLAPYARDALEWSHRLSHHLGWLRRYFGDKLPERRLGDRRRIVWGDWETTAAQTSLRVLIDVNTAVAAKLLREDDLRASEGAPIMDRALDTYRELVAANSFGRNGGVTNIGMQATWLGFLNHGVIPYEPRVDSQLHDVPFVEGDPFAASADHPSIELDNLTSAQWHLRTGDPGNLGRLERGSAAWQALDAASPGIFREWWQLVQPMVLDQLSPAERVRRGKRQGRFEVQLNAPHERWRTAR